MSSASSVAMNKMKFLCAEALRPAMDPLITLFQEATGCDVAVAYGNIGTIADRLRKGEL